MSHDVVIFFFVFCYLLLSFLFFLYKVMFIVHVTDVTFIYAIYAHTLVDQGFSRNPNRNFYTYCENVIFTSTSVRASTGTHARLQRVTIAVVLIEYTGVCMLYYTITCRHVREDCIFLNFFVFITIATFEER